jgi:hypothetical protein
LAAGVLNPKDSSQLHGIPVEIMVAIDKHDNTRNAVKGYKSLKGNVVAAPVVKPAADGKLKPWQAATANKAASALGAKVVGDDDAPF